MVDAVVVVQAPHLACGVVDVLKAGDPGVVRDRLATPVSANVEDVVECHFYDPAVTDGEDGLTFMALYHLFDEKAHSRAHVHHRLALADGRRNWRKGALAGPVV